MIQSIPLSTVLKGSSVFNISAYQANARYNVNYEFHRPSDLRSVGRS
jgi:hypothetical protein